jgi:methylmalonyl-CoA/ethylmalonyl-CoA epimerase
MTQPLRMTFDHLGVVCKGISVGRPHMVSVFGVRQWTDSFVDPIQKVVVQFGSDPSGIVYELIEPSGPDSPIAATLVKGQNLLNHVAYRVPDLEQAARDLRAKRCMPLGPAAPATAFGGNHIQFFLTPLRFILELIQGQLPPHEFHEL